VSTIVEVAPTTTTTTTTTSSLLTEHRPWWRSRVTLTAVILGAMLVCYFALKAEYAWPGRLVWTAFPTHLNDFQTWLVDQRNGESPSVVIRAFNGFATFLDDLVSWLTRLCGWLTWIGTAVVGVLVALRFGGAKAAIWAIAAFATFALSGLWLESIQTLALMLAAVSLSLLVGIPLGIAAGRSDRFEHAITPVLDAMQIVPAFAYLMPIVILFSVGPGAAVITTMIYAVPPAIRITSLGIRGVASNTVEAAEAMGSTRRQILQKVQLPLARRTLLLGVNQTILFALSMVVIAGLIGGKGLGDVVTSGLNSYPALAILAGIVIVVMAMALDRITEAVADRTDPTRRHLTPALRRRLRYATIATAVGCVGAVAVARLLGASADYSRRTLRDWLLARIQAVLDYIANPDTVLFRITSWIGDTIITYGLQPLHDFLLLTPWFVVLAGFTTIALVVSGWRPALTTFLMLGLIGVIGQWEPAMDTASQVLVATVLAVAVGLGLGILAAESRAFSRALRPVNDVLQTLPQLVYLIPLIYLMPVSTVPGVIAGVLYAFPIVVRLVENGLRNVEANAVEAATSFGATRRQVLLKVRIPLAQDAIMLGVNQGIIMVLAVVVIGGLVGSPGLGYEVAQGLGRSDFGLGVIASLAILALGIALDRVTRSVRGTRPERSP
jgi:glycine betaine/proline transport system permease protein